MLPHGGTSDDGRPEWTVSAAKTEDTLRILIDEIVHDTSHDLGIDPGLQKDASRSTSRSSWPSTRPRSPQD